MDVQPFSAEAQELAARLEAGDLTLGQIRGIEDEILLKLPTDEKIKKIGEPIFSRIDQKRQSLVGRKVIELDHQDGVAAKVQRLKLLHADQLPEETEAEVVVLMREIPLEEDSRTQEAALKQLESIRFEASHPIVYELDDEALTSNFASRVRQIAKTMIEQNSLIPFKEGLNFTQQKEIYRYAGGSVHES